MIRISKKSSKRTRTSKILRMAVTPDHLPPMQLSFAIDAFLDHAGIACFSINICSYLPVQVIERHSL